MTKKKEQPTQLQEAVKEAISAADAKAMLEKDKADRGQKCAVMIQQALRECRCQLVPVVTIQGSNVIGNMTIVPGE